MGKVCFLTPGLKPWRFISHSCSILIRYQLGALLHVILIIRPGWWSDYLEWCWPLWWEKWARSKGPYTSNSMIWLQSSTSLFLTTPGSEVLTWPHSHKGTRKDNPAICLYMGPGVDNWDICQPALTTTTIKLRTVSPGVYFQQTCLTLPKYCPIG